MDNFLDFTGDALDEFRNGFVVIDSDDDDDIQFVESRPSPLYQQPTPIFRYPQTLPSHIQSLDSVQSRCGTLQANFDVEIVVDPKKENSFLRIKQILRNQQTGDTTLRGIVFQRSNKLPVPNRYHNEVCMVVKRFKNDDPQLFYINGAEEFPLSSVVRLRKIVVTCDPWPFHSWRDHPHHRQVPVSKIFREGRLVCRYIYSRVFEGFPKSKKAGERAKAKEGLLRRVHETESDICDQRAGHESQADAEHPEFFKSYLASGALSYATAFCGAGGDLQGAKYAGFKVKFAFDKNETACETCEKNHPDIPIYCTDQLDVIKDETHPIGRPVLHAYHCSFPCQDFSKANRRNGANYGLMADLLLGTLEHVRVMQPLVHTQEQTSGLVTDHPEYFCTILSDLVGQNYNVRWKLVQLSEHGLPALRNRLIIFAAKNSIPLPEFPEATHGNKPGLKPLVTINDAISFLDERHTCHMDMSRPFSDQKQMNGYDGSKTLAKCITTNGGRQCHPSGQREFTPREMACLQTFSPSYQFVGGKTEVKRQIGNAVPPKIWKQFLLAIKRTLRDFGSGKIDREGNPTDSQPPSRFLPKATHLSGLTLEQSATTASPQTVDLTSTGSRSAPRSTFPNQSSRHFDDVGNNQVIDLTDSPTETTNMMEPNHGPHNQPHGVQAPRNLIDLTSDAGHP